MGRSIVHAGLVNTLPQMLSPIYLRTVGITATEIVIFAILAWRKERWVHALGIALIFAGIMPKILVWHIH
jgi:hypothetical protein